jgi:parallel beta-helix repeat protein
MTKLVLVAALIGVLGFTAPARAETINCTAIASLPYVISAQGVYCFTGHLNTSITVGNAITVNANNVIIDLNGYKLGGLSAGLGTTAVGIYATQRSNITIRNGTVRGFLQGIWLDDPSPYTTSQGHVIEDIRADQNTLTGIYVDGSGNIIRNNLVVTTGGATCCGANVDATGIVASGSGPRVLNNDVIEVTAQGTGMARGVYFGFGTTTGALAVNNRITQATRGIDYGANTGKYRDTLTFGVGAPSTGGTDAGNNN